MTFELVCVSSGLHSLGATYLRAAAGWAAQQTLSRMGETTRFSSARENPGGAEPEAHVPPRLSRSAPRGGRAAPPCAAPLTCWAAAGAGGAAPLPPQCSPSAAARRQRAPSPVAAERPRSKAPPARTGSRPRSAPGPRRKRRRAPGPSLNKPGSAAPQHRRQVPKSGAAGRSPGLRSGSEKPRGERGEGAAPLPAAPGELPACLAACSPAQWFKPSLQQTQLWPREIKLPVAPCYSRSCRGWGRSRPRGSGAPVVERAEPPGAAGGEDPSPEVRWQRGGWRYQRFN